MNVYPFCTCVTSSMVPPAPQHHLPPHVARNLPIMLLPLLPPPPLHRKKSNNPSLQTTSSYLVSPASSFSSTTQGPHPEQTSTLSSSIGKIFFVLPMSFSSNSTSSLCSKVKGEAMGSCRMGCECNLTIKTKNRTNQITENIFNFISSLN